MIVELNVATYVPRYLKEYKEALPGLKKELGIANVMMLPKVEKVVVNCGQGEAVKSIKVLEGAIDDLTRITGQKPVMNRAKKSIAGFKLREGMPIGCSVTLRGHRMYEFLERLINIAIPRIRDFRGFSAKAFDGRGNYTLGLKEQIVFPEIDYDKVDATRGIGITIVTSARTDIQGKALMDVFKFPFKK